MPDNSVQEIKDRLNIVDVLSGYIQLKKAGTSFKALCPFHSERTPSLNISPQRQIWHCFGCGEGGDIFEFVMKYENLDFREALKILAQKAGVQLPEYRPQDPKEQEEKELFLRINDFAARLYHRVLTSEEHGKEAMKYLTDRGLTADTVKQWQIGFAPDEFHFLHHALLKKNIKEDSIIKSGVCVKGEKGDVYDRFRGRVTFPVFDYFGRIVGFSARILPKFDDGKSGKYINSPETLIYQKSKILFGLNFAKDEIRKNNEAVIVEGQMDAIASHQAGVKNVVASSGTALTQHQISSLGKLTRNLKFCFDADQAGQNALKKAREVQLSVISSWQLEVSHGADSTIARPFNQKVVDLSDSGAKDADELIKKEPQRWQQLTNEAKPISDYVFEQIFKDFNPHSVESKKRTRDILLEYISSLYDNLEKDHYIKLLANKLEFEEKNIRYELAALESKKIKVTNKNLSYQIKPSSNQSIILEKEVLGGIIFDREFKEKIRPDFAAEDFENLEIRSLAQAAILSEELSSATQTSSLAKEAVFMVESLQDQLDKAALFKRLIKSYSQLKVHSLKKKQKILQSEMGKAEALLKQEELRKLQAEFARVSQLRMEWEKYS